jgi:hypothetical protein
MKKHDGCDCSRRNFLQHTAGFSGFLAAQGLLGDFARTLFGQDTKVKKGAGGGRAKSVILLWMGGGPSQLDTFDPKPGVKTSGEFKPIDTAIKGAQVSENLPRIAQEMDKLSILRSVVTGEPEHQRGSYLLHTGQKFRPSFPFPSMGSMVSYELSESFDVPGYVTINGGGYSPTFLGFEHSPFTISDPGSALRLIREAGQKRQQLGLADDLAKEFNESRAGVNVKKRETFTDRISKLQDSPFTRALDLGKEPDKLKDSYGRNGFGTGCLLARRLVEVGTRFIEVHLGGWDTHEDNFKKVKNLCGVLDPAFATLMRDLKDRGLYEETVVIWMGEFGRTPEINKTNGRDHWANGFSIVMGGGGIKGGRILGAMDRTGQGLGAEPIHVPDLIATVYHCLGMDPKKKYYSPQGSLVKATEDGKPIKALL